MTITVREKEYEVVENEYASMNAILLFLSLLDPKTSEKFATMDATLEDLRQEISKQYDELSNNGKKSINEMSSRVMFMLNTDPELFPKALNYRTKAYEYIKTLVPSAPLLDTDLSGTEIADFLLAVAIPESIRNGKSDDKPPAPKTPKLKKVGKGFKSPVVAESEDLTESPDDEAAGKLIERLEATGGFKDKVVDIKAIAEIDPTILDATDIHYANLLAEHQKNTVIILNNAEVAPLSVEEELEG
jgi:hypothetical protein